MLSKITKFIQQFNLAEKERIAFPVAKKIIHLDRLGKNIFTIKKQYLKNGEKFLVSVKANAYGHDILPVAKFLEAKKLADYFGVAHLEEARLLRKNKVKTNILVLGQMLFDEESIDFVIKNEIEISVSSLDFLRKVINFLQKTKRKIKIHLMIDTGMGREGILSENLKEENLTEIFKNKNVELVGVYTHFAVSDEKKKASLNFTKQQIENFLKIKKLMEKVFGNKKIIFHSANSGAILLHKKANFDMVRSGLLTYGYGENLPKEIKPVLELKSKITLIKKFSAKSFIGYGKTYQTKKEEIVGIVPIGYGDGLSRAGSNKFKFIVNGKFVPVLGRISMDQISVLLDKKAKVGDEVVIIGEIGDKKITAENLAKLSNMIPYEILTNFGFSERIRSEYEV